MFWLIMSVLLFYHDPAVLALSLQGTADNVARGMNSSPEACHEWEMFDGTDCVCATNQTSRCTNGSGVVCDDLGGKYGSVCQFAHQMCSGLISHERSIASCGACDILRLVNDSNPAQYEEFLLERPQTNLSKIYRSSRPDRLAVFYEKTLHKWVVGHINSTWASVSMVQQLYAEHPQDSHGGMLVATPTGNNVTWVTQPSLKLQCADQFTKRRRMKRFISIIIGIVAFSVAAAATTATLHDIQAKKGCLYYPSVCHMRDRIKNDLGPEVRRLQSSFVSQYGDVAQYKNAVEGIVDNVMDLKDRLVRIKDLHTNLTAGLSEIVTKLGEIPDRFPALQNALKEYRQWLEKAKIGALISKISFQIEFLVTMVSLPSLLAASTGYFTLASAGIVAAVSIGFSAVDIVSSIKEEKRVKENLERVEANYLKAKSNLLTAFQKMKEFQITFCKTTINFLQAVSGAGMSFHPFFQNLYNFITGTYQSVPSLCDQENVYSKSKRDALAQLKNLLTPIISYLKNNEEDLLTRIRHVQEMNQFLQEITHRVTNHRADPSSLFRLLKESKPMLAEKQFQTLYDLLEYISVTSLPSRSCYWGWDLNQIRNHVIKETNYLQSPVCSSPEIDSLTSVIQQTVSQTTSPCTIAQLVKGSVFRSTYSVLRYIAEYILPTIKCYWGYDLDQVRRSNFDTEIENSLMSSTLFNTLELMAEAVALDTENLQTARNGLCRQYGICSTEWQNFILCAVWKGTGNVGSLTCGDTVISGQCIPPRSPVQSCRPTTIIGILPRSRAAVL